MRRQSAPLGVETQEGLWAKRRRQGCQDCLELVGPGHRKGVGCLEGLDLEPMEAAGRKAYSGDCALQSSTAAGREVYCTVQASRVRSPARATGHPGLPFGV